MMAGALARSFVQHGDRWLAALSASLLLVLLVRTGVGPGEFLRFTAGVLLLWGPTCALLWFWLTPAVDHIASRLALSTAGAYALCAAAFFGAASVGLPWLFHLAQAPAALGALLLWRRRRSEAAEARSEWKLDWRLVVLVLASLLATARYMEPVHVSGPEDAQTFRYRLHRDHLYHVGIAYGLGRSIPPDQMAIRAGTPERAYHVFMHVNTLLLGRYSASSDLLRTHLILHLMCIEVLLCLGLFALSSRLAGAPAAGHLAVALTFVLAVPWPALTSEAHRLFYFTLFPHYSSGLEPVAAGSPQQYSGLVVAYGCMVALLALAAGRRDAPPPSSVALLLALMLAASMRFRIHVYLALVPGWGLLMLSLVPRWRSRAALWALPLGVLVSAALYLEMSRPEYLATTAAVEVGYNGLAENVHWVNRWPFASSVADSLASVVRAEPLRAWLWQALSIPALVLFNLLGIPFCLAVAALLSDRETWRRFGPFLLVTLGAAALSILGAGLLTMEYDPYSLPGQLLLHVRWYLLPLAAAGAWRVHRRASARFPAWRRAAAPVAAAVAVALLAARPFIPEERWELALRARKLAFSAGEWAGLRYLRDETPPDSVVLAVPYGPAVFSGIAGRATYWEMPENILDKLARRMRPDDDRDARVHALWRERDPARFCEALLETPADYLVERDGWRLHVTQPACLSPAWRAPRGEMEIWKVSRDRLR